MHHDIRSTGTRGTVTSSTTGWFVHSTIVGTGNVRHHLEEFMFFFAFGVVGVPPLTALDRSLVPKVFDAEFNVSATERTTPFITNCVCFSLLDLPVRTFLEGQGLSADSPHKQVLLFAKTQHVWLKRPLWVQKRRKHGASSLERGANSLWCRLGQSPWTGKRIATLETPGVCL